MTSRQKEKRNYLNLSGQLEKHDSSIVTMKAFENYLMSAG
jgi:hypothetical protein